MSALWLSSISKHHKEWTSIVRSFGHNEPEDIVQEMYLKIHKYIEPEKIIVNDEVNKGYIWFTLRTLFLNDVSKQKFEKLNEISLEQTDCDKVQKQTFDVIIDRIELIVKRFDWYDEKLFNLYFKTDLSMRDIARETTISLSSIANSIKKYKRIIQEEIGEDYLDYLNKDYEKI